MVNLGGYSYSTEDLKKASVLGLGVLGFTGVSYLSYRGLRDICADNKSPEEVIQKEDLKDDSEEKPKEVEKPKEAEITPKKKETIDITVQEPDNTELPDLPELKHMPLKQSKKILTMAKYMPPKRYNNDTKKKIYRFCITGGPCAGKSTCFSMLMERFSPRYKVFVCPEIASLTINGGVTIHPDKFTPRTHANFTKSIVKMQLDLEEYYMNLAN